MGYVLASSVIREVHGWPPALKLALIVAANEANAKTGELRLSASQLAELTGGSERSARVGIARAIAERMCSRPTARRVLVVFPDPVRIYPDERSGPIDPGPDERSGSDAISICFRWYQSSNWLSPEYCF